MIIVLGGNPLGGSTAQIVAPHFAAICVSTAAATTGAYLCSRDDYLIN